ncbi:MAG: hypothetical protein ACI9X4_001859, partial [Glaciecola sp.]
MRNLIPSLTCERPHPGAGFHIKGKVLTQLIKYALGR